jgi:putative endonuclease
MSEAYYVYILASRRNGTLYIGVTNDLVRRIHEHKTGAVAGFTRKYGVKQLVYFEQFADPRTAIQREKTMKLWPRKWKLNAIERDNPTWRDLYDDIALG